MSKDKKVELKNTKLNPGDKIVDLRERVEVTSTDKNPFRRKGVKSMVSPMVAEKGKKAGHYEK